MQKKLFSFTDTLVLYTLLALLLVCASFYDLKISSALYEPLNIYGKIMGGFGHLPASLMVSLGSIMIYHGDPRNNKIVSVLRILMALFGVLFGLYFFISESYDVFHYHWIIALDAVILLVFDFFVFKRFKDYDKKLLTKVGFFLYFSVGLTSGILLVIKEIFVRPRYRLIALNSEVPFKNWWQIDREVKKSFVSMGIAKEEFRSFPSGHTGAATAACLMAVLPRLMGKKNSNTRLIFNLGVLYSMLLALGRIISGAHFLSDVTISMAVGFSCILLCYRLFVEGDFYDDVLKFLKLDK